MVRLTEVNLLRAGYQVVTAYEGEEVLEKVRSENPDLVLLDLMLPPADGWEVLKTLKSNLVTAEIPVVLLTASNQDADVFRAWQLGVDVYLTKPFNPLELLEMIRRMRE